MTDDKILEVLHLYQREITSKPLRMYDDQLAHCAGMIPKMVEFIKEGRRDKVFRWLGFLQGVLYCKGIYTIEEMANHNRPTDET